MAISREKKQSLVKEFTESIESAKLIAVAEYAGLTVPEIQELRKVARENGVVIKVIKNRLVRVSFAATEVFKATDTSMLKTQLLYATSADDEVAPAQVLAKFAKDHEALKLIAGFTADGKALDTAEITALANLPSKDQLRGQVVSVIAAPLTQFLGVAGGVQRGLVQVLNQKAEQA